MSYVIEQTKEKIKELEELLDNPETGEVQREHLPKSIERYKQKLLILEKNEEDLLKVKDDMKAIMSHTNAIDDKYKCRSVRFMFWLSDFTEKYVSLNLGKWIANYTVNKIHAPICSIVAGTKPDLPPMPQYSDPVADAREAWQKAQREELLKFRQITINFLEKPPTFKERVQIKYRKIIKKLLLQQES